MKNIFLALILVSFLACKNDKKEADNNPKTTEQENTPKEVITNINVPEFSTWGKVSVELEDGDEMYSTELAHVISRTDTDSKSSYAHTRDIPVEYAEVYRASVIVKKGDSGSLFGLRIAGEYPDRVDAVFNLETGEVKGVKKARDFENESANIESLGSGWYKCSVMAEVTADKVRLFLGPTTSDKAVNAWTVKTAEPTNAYVAVNSLKLEKITLQ
ncbi:MAG: hypothetical protein AAF901_00360 [Bacteroidota bacterium]